MSFRLTFLSACFKSYVYFKLPSFEYSDTLQYTFDQKSTRNYVKLYKKNHI